MAFEENNLNCVALTLYQLFSDNFDVNYANRNVKMIRTIILYRDKLVSACKNLNVRLNGDMAYIIYGISQILGTFDTPSIYDEIERLNLDGTELFKYVSENSCLGGKDDDAYNYIVKIYNEWFYGEENYNKHFDDAMSVPGKKCFGLIEEG